MLAKFCMQCGERLHQDRWEKQAKDVPFCPPKNRGGENMYGCAEHIERFDPVTGLRLDGVRASLRERIQVVCDGDAGAPVDVGYIFAVSGNCMAFKRKVPT